MTHPDPGSRTAEALRTDADSIRTDADSIRTDADALRTRTVRILFAGVGVNATAYIAMLTAGTLAAADMGGAEWSGVPSTASVVGTAIGVGTLSALSTRRGRRPALMSGFLLGVAGAAAAAVGVALGVLGLLLIGMLAAGCANAAGQLARYVGGDLYLPPRRARTIGIVVWGATVGAVLGPNLVAPAAGVARSLGLVPLAGAFVVATALFAVAWLTSLLLRPDPSRLVEHADHGRDSGSSAGSVRIRELLSRRAVSTALVALTTAQVVMVMIMTMTPIHIRQHGGGLEVVGFVFSAHILGMFALSPLSGRLADRFGSVPVVLAGFAVLIVAAVLSATAPAHGGPLLVIALFLLGFGWNLAFVAGSALLAGDLPLALRARAQGSVDVIVWSASAISSLASGPLLSVAGYSALGAVAVVLALLPAVFIATRREAPAVAGA